MKNSCTGCYIFDDPYGKKLFLFVKFKVFVYYNILKLLLLEFEIQGDEYLFIQLNINNKWKQSCHKCFIRQINRAGIWK